MPGTGSSHVLGRMHRVGDKYRVACSVGEEAAGSPVCRGDSKILLRVAVMEGPKAEGIELGNTLPGRGWEGDVDCSSRYFWSRDELSSGLVPSGGFLGEAGKMKYILLPRKSLHVKYLICVAR